jgi:hypothetical protein
MVYKLLSRTPQDQIYELVKQILPLFDYKLFNDMDVVTHIMDYTPEKYKEEVSSLIKKYKNGELNERLNYIKKLLKESLFKR